MNEIDVTLLQLSSAAPQGVAEMLRLSNLCIDSGFHTTVSTNPADLAKRRQSGRPAIVVIESLGSSDYDVQALVSILRCRQRVGVIMIVADDSAARSRALNWGADLCLSYPVDADEFRSAVHAVARRCAPAGGPSGDGEGEARRFAPIGEARREHRPSAIRMIDPGSFQHAGSSHRSAPPYPSPHSDASDLSLPSDLPDAAAAPTTWLLTSSGWSLRSPEGATIALTATERVLMSSLFAAQPSVVSHEELQAQCGYAGAASRNPVASAISRLKRKCQADGVWLPIDNSRGNGYRFGARCAIEN